MTLYYYVLANTCSNSIGLLSSSSSRVPARLKDPDPNTELPVEISLRNATEINLFHFFARCRQMAQKFRRVQFVLGISLYIYIKAIIPKKQLDG